MKIGMIDSGIQEDRFYNISQYWVDSKGVAEENLQDNNGHGSSMFSIIREKLFVEDEIISLRLENRRENFNLYVAKAIDFCVNNKVQIINISLGSNFMNHINDVASACKDALNNNVLVVSSASNQNDIIFPWACEGTLKVRQGHNNDGNFAIEPDEYGIYNIFVNSRRYGMNHKISLGNSAATAYITSLLVEELRGNTGKRCDIKDVVNTMLGRHTNADFKVDRLFNGIQLITSNIDFIDKNYNQKRKWGRAIIVPFSKEMDSVISYGKEIQIVVGSGGVETALAREKGIKVVDIEDDLSNFSLETIVIGYLDKISCINPAYSEDNLVNIIIKNGLKVFSFIRFSPENEEKLKKNNILYQCATYITNNELFVVRKAVPYNLLPHKPILGVFGTSSKQGKFTCQLELKRLFEERNIKVDFIGTEHQSALVGSVFDYPSGYRGRGNINISLEDSIELLQKSIFYIDQKCKGEIILLGGQSWLIPFDIERQTAIYNLAFLEATRPDYAVVVVNPEIDYDEYISDTIKTLESVYRCNIIALTFPDKKPVSKRNIALKVKRTSENIREVSQELKSKFGKNAGCITDKSFMEEIVDYFI